MYIWGVATPTWGMYQQALTANFPMLPNSTLLVQPVLDPPGSGQDPLGPALSSPPN
jgi:hypothetical protein